MDLKVSFTNVLGVERAVPPGGKMPFFTNESQQKNQGSRRCAWCKRSLDESQKSRYCSSQCRSRYHRYRCTESEYQKRDLYLQAWEELDTKPKTAVKVDGYLLPDKKAAKRFRAYKKRKVETGKGEYKGDLQSLQEIAAGGELSASSARRIIPFDYDAPEEMIQDGFPLEYYRKNFKELPKTMQKLLGPILYRSNDYAIPQKPENYDLKLPDWAKEED